MGRVIVRYDGPGDVYVLPAHALTVARGGAITVSADTADELTTLEHDNFTVIGAEPEPEPAPVLPQQAPEQRPKTTRRARKR